MRAKLQVIDCKLEANIKNISRDLPFYNFLLEFDRLLSSEIKKLNMTKFGSKVLMRAVRFRILLEHECLTCERFYLLIQC